MDFATDLKILIVDDQPEMQLALARILNRAGYNTLEASSGDEAILIAIEHQPALVLLDIVLPGKDGYEICRILKENPTTSDIHIIFVSGKKVSVEDISLGLHLGADDYIRRPFDANELLARVKVQLRLQNAEKQLMNSLQYKKHEYQKLIGTSSDLLARFNEKLEHVYVSNSILSATGLTSEDYIGKTNEELGMPEHLVTLWNRSLREVFDRCVDKKIEFQFESQNGVKHYQSIITPESIENNKVITALGIINQCVDCRTSRRT